MTGYPVERRTCGNYCRLHKNSLPPTCDRLGGRWVAGAKSLQQRKRRKRVAPAGRFDRTFVELKLNEGPSFPQPG